MLLDVLAQGAPHARERAEASHDGLGLMRLPHINALLQLTQAIRTAPALYNSSAIELSQ